MAYATQADMVERFGEAEVIELTDRADLGQVDAAVLEGALADAESEINSYIAARYPLPLAEVPRVLVRFACDMARYYLEGVLVREEVTTRYQDAIKFLKAVSSGAASLGVAAPQTEAPATTGGPQVVTQGRTFTADSLGDF